MCHNQWYRDPNQLLRKSLQREMRKSKGKKQERDVSLPMGLGDPNQLLRQFIRRNEKKGKESKDRKTSRKKRRTVKNRRREKQN